MPKQILHTSTLLLISYFLVSGSIVLAGLTVVKHGRAVDIVDWGLALALTMTFTLAAMFFTSDRLAPNFELVSEGGQPRGRKILRFFSSSIVAVALAVAANAISNIVLK